MIVQYLPLFWYLLRIVSLRARVSWLKCFVSYVSSLYVLPSVSTPQALFVQIWILHTEIISKYYEITRYVIYQSSLLKRCRTVEVKVIAENWSEFSTVSWQLNDAGFFSSLSFTDSLDLRCAKFTDNWEMLWNFKPELKHWRNVLNW